MSRIGITEAQRRRLSSVDQGDWDVLGAEYTSLGDKLGADLTVDVPASSIIGGGLSWVPGRVQIDMDVLGVEPSRLDMTDAGHRQAMVEMHGTFLHALGHELYTRWEGETEAGRRELGASLEDIRVEHRLVSERPGSRQWLRASAGLRASHSVEECKDRGVGTIVLLLETVGRALLGILEPSDVRAALDLLDGTLSEEDFNDVIDVIYTLKVIGGAPGEMIALVDRLWKVLGQDKAADDAAKGDSKDEGRQEPGDGAEEPGGESGGEDPEKGTDESEGEGAGEGAEGPPGQGGEPSDAQSGEGESSASSIDPLSRTQLSQAGGSLAKATRDALDKIEEEEASASELRTRAQTLSGAAGKRSTSEKFAPALAEVGADEVEDSELDAELDPEGGHGRGWGGGITRRSQREPKSGERRLRRGLTDRLRRVQWRDRDMTEIRTMLPPGRLSTREAVRGAAERTGGRMPSAKPWKSRKHKVVETPKVRVAVLCDISGSMSGVVGAVSVSMWVTSAAVRDTGGQAIGVSFGDRAERIVAKSRKAPEKVSMFAADGGMEAIKDALDISVEDLDLYDKAGGHGPRVVIVVSDGCWVDGWQAEQADLELTALVRAGVKVIHVGVGSLPQPHPGSTTVMLKSASEIDKVIGDAIAKVLGDA